MAWTAMSDEELDQLTGTIAHNPDRVVILPDEAYATNAKGKPYIRIRYDNIKWMLPRLLWERLRPYESLGNDYLIHPEGQDNRNVNPLIMERISRAGGNREKLDRCRNGHVYAIVGERTGGYRCQRCYELMKQRERAAHYKKLGHMPGEKSAIQLNAEKTHCPQGHEYTPENTLYLPSDQGRRRCRECYVELNRTKAERRRQARAAARDEGTAA